MATKKIGVGMIGCGGMGRVVTRLLLQQSPDIELRGLYDPDQRSIDNTQKEFGTNATVYDSYEELVNAADIDWVLIASWNCYHKEQAIAAFRAGKHVFCQKPLATNTDDALAMYREGVKSGNLFNIGFTLRYSPHYRKLHELISSGAIGDIISMEFNETLRFNHGGYIMGDWRRKTEFAGTHLLEKCCHDIDLVNWLTGSRAKRVASFGGLNFYTPENAHHEERIGKDSGGRAAYRTWGGLVGLDPFTSDKDIVDNQVAIIEYENGVRATFHTNCNAGIHERRMYICGTEGAIRADVIAGTIELKRIGFETEVENLDTKAKGGHGGGDPVLAQELADTMLNGTPPSATLQDGLTSSLTCFAIDEAMESGKVVDLAPYWERAQLAQTKEKRRERGTNPAPQAVRDTVAGTVLTA